MSYHKLLIRAIYVLIAVSLISAVAGIVFLAKSKSIIFNNSTEEYTITNEAVEPFPVSVNVHTEIISDSTEVNKLFYETIASDPEAKQHWWNKVAAVFANKKWYQNLASPVSRIIVIWPGERKEEVVKNIGGVLRWTKEEKMKFIELVDSTEPALTEGKYFPGQYVTHRNATPEDIHGIITNKFNAEIIERYAPEVEAQVPLEDAIIVASLLEREASDFENMREVAGVIWNRIFIDMPLQLDATLQYVKGSKPHEPKWWPVVRPADKYLKSPYNTYSHKGLPPGPIANPSTESILAALNPIQTDCLFYFHTNKGEYYCSPTYEGHVEKLKSLYGRGS